MAKIYGLFGSMTGKVADVVMSVRNGEQIARKYQPIVSNPNTPAQLATRAKLKLMSQLSTVMAPVIAMRRVGAMSKRNVFVKENYGLTSYASNTASIELTKVQLTKSVVSLPEVRATRNESALTVSLAGTTGLDVDRVVYAMFVKQEDDTLRYATSTVVSTPGTFNTFEGTMNMDGSDSKVIVYAYGVRDNTDAARVVFGNMVAPTAQDLAKLIVSSTLLESDVTLTETRAAESLPSE